MLSWRTVLKRSSNISYDVVVRPIVLRIARVKSSWERSWEIRLETRCALIRFLRHFDYIRFCINRSWSTTIWFRRVEIKSVNFALITTQLETKIDSTRLTPIRMASLIRLVSPGAVTDSVTPFPPKKTDDLSLVITPQKWWPFLLIVLQIIVTTRGDRLSSVLLNSATKTVRLSLGCHLLDGVTGAVRSPSYWRLWIPFPIT